MCGHDGLVVSTLASQLQGWRFKSCLRPACNKLARSPHVSWDYFGYSCFLTHSKDSISKLPTVRERLSPVLRPVPQPPSERIQTPVTKWLVNIKNVPYHATLDD